MNTEQLNELYKTIAALQAKGDDDGAKALLMKHLADLPEDVRTEIMFDMFTSSLEAEASGLALKRDIQEAGLKAAKAIKAQQK